MPTFATINDMIKRFGEQELIEVTDDANSGRMDESQVNEALADATVALEGYIAARVTLPFITVPAVLVKHCCDVARYFVHDDSPTDRIAINYENAIAWAKDVSKGIVTLNDSTQPTVDTSSNNQVQVSEGERVFDNSTLDQY